MQANLYQCDVLARLVCEARKLTQSINYIHKANRDYLRSYQEILIKNEPQRTNCVNSFINPV